MINSSDKPAGGPPLTLDKGIGVDPNDVVVRKMDLVWDFRLYVTARTADARNAANQVYTNRAWAKWRFVGSGTITYQTPPYAWQGYAEGDNRARVEVVQGWTPLSDGSQPPQLSGELANDAVLRDNFNQ